MTTEAEIEKKFWKALKDDRTVMLGIADEEEGHTRPMTAQLENDEHGAIWFFTSTDTELSQALDAGGGGAFLHFASKGHDVFASVNGRLVRDNDRATIDRLWNPFVAAWYKGGKDDPKLDLLRFEPERAEIWLNANSVFSGIKLLLGRDPKRDYKDKVAEVDLRS